MAFRIVLLGAEEALLTKHLTARIENQAWVLAKAGCEFTFTSEASLVDYFDRKAPNVVVSLAPEDNTLDAASLSATVALCKAQSIPFIQVSCYSGFSGDMAPERAESMEVSALSEEALGGGQPALNSLLQGFEAQVSELERHIILRCSWRLDGTEKALLSVLAPMLMSSTPLVVSDHNFGSPVSCGFIADSIVAIIQQILTGADNWGIYHIHSADSCSEAEFSEHLLRQLQKELHEEFTPPTVAGPDDSRRFFEGNANLTGRRITDCFGIQQPTWRRGFGRLLREWLVSEGVIVKKAKELS